MEDENAMEVRAYYEAYVLEVPASPQKFLSRRQKRSTMYFTWLPRRQ